MPWSNQPIAAPVVIVEAGAAGTGLFVYSGAPATGKLIASITAGSGTDSYGNAYDAGISSYGPAPGSPVVQVTDGQINLQDGAVVLPASLFTTISRLSVTAQAPTSRVSDTQGSLELQSAVSGSVPRMLTNAILNLLDPSNPNLVETWHSMPAMSAGWSIGGFAKYRLTALGDLQVAFQDLVPGTDTDGTVIWAAGSLPSSYRPPANHRVACYTDVLRQPTTGVFEAAALQFQPDGSIQCFGTANAATRADLYATIPLGA